MKRWGQDAIAYPQPITLIKCKWAKKTHNTPLFYILCQPPYFIDTQLKAKYFKNKCKNTGLYNKNDISLLYNINDDDLINRVLFDKRAGNSWI